MLFIFISLHFLSTCCKKDKSDSHLQEYNMKADILNIIILYLSFIIILIIIVSCQLIHSVPHTKNRIVLARAMVVGVQSVDEV